AERDDGSGFPSDRDDQPVAEPIDDVAVVAPHHEPALKEQRLWDALLEKVCLQRVARVRSVTDAKLLDRRRRESAALNLLTRAATGRRPELSAKVRGRELVDFQERFPGRRVPPRIVVLFGDLRKSEAELSGKESDDVLEP